MNPPVLSSYPYLWLTGLVCQSMLGCQTLGIDVSRSLQCRLIRQVGLLRIAQQHQGTRTGAELLVLQRRHYESFRGHGLSEAI